jgi:hypothetical protein
MASLPPLTVVLLLALLAGERADCLHLSSEFAVTASSKICTQKGTNEGVTALLL